MAAKYNIIIDQGSDYDLSINLTKDGVPINLVGYTVRGQIRPTISSSTLTASFTGLAVADTLGQFRASLTAATTTAIAAGLYYYDIEIYKSPYVTRLLEGTLTVKPEVTR